MSDDKQITSNDIHKLLFINLVNMLASSAMQQLGKLVNPVTNETEVNLDGAQVTIDMIEMLKARTEGNLDQDEERIITDLLASLQMNYVQTAREAKEADGKDEEENEATAPSDEKPAEPADDKKDTKDPKYHKSYGE